MKKNIRLFIGAGALFATLNIAMIGNASAADAHDVVEVIHGSHYDSHGFDSHGYNRHGYHRNHGYNRHGYNHHGHYNRHHDTRHHNTHH